MKLSNDLKLTRALKEYELNDLVASAPVTFSGEFDARMDKLIYQKQRSYNMRVFFKYTLSSFIIIALIGSLFFLLLQQQGTNDELNSLQDQAHVLTVPAARGNIYDRNGILLVSSRLSSIDNSYIREYHTEYASHILGNEGAELSFDEILRGTEGKQIAEVSEDGTVLDSEVTDEPVPGQHVYLTLDIKLQEADENALREQIESINRERKSLGHDDSELIPGGAVVVVDANTGEILAAASYPTFDLTSFDENRESLQSDNTYPMLNRTTQGLYRPGSTFYMVTTLAGFRNLPSVKPRDYVVDDTGIFDKYESSGFVLNCWIYDIHGIGHGPLDIVQALECSCDFYFMQLADWFGAEAGAGKLADAANEFGLGVATGIEIPENEGHPALPAVKEEVTGDNTWYVVDTKLSAFGKGYNSFTPVQLANYAATIANGGTLYSLSLLQSVKSSDNSQELITYKPTIRNIIEERDIIEIIQEGMTAASRGRDGTARSVFGDYPINVASKTGTVQTDEHNYIDGVFVAYAPAENPEIAISVVLEKGGSNGAIIKISKNIFDYYFNITNR
ncbi:MAG: penicillin-binding transpeptidase domain-containing protein [Oscillospiraceae bacterium]|nr:penicillin-binding transpeptidase domain-containing protein [Oscillospiraceae bacterium]